MAQARFDSSREQPAAGQAPARPACSMCRARPARSDMPWCGACYDSYCSMSVAQYLEWRQNGRATRALPRIETTVQGPQAVAQALRPVRAQIKDWAEQMGIDVDDGIEADRKWRDKHGAVPALPDGRPEPPRQDGVSDSGQDARP